MASKKRYSKRVYLIEKIKDSSDWPKGSRIWALQPCKGWRIISKGWL